MKSDGPIRIAQIIGKMWGGGVEAMIFNYYRAIDHSKIQFDFFYDADSTVEPPEDLIKMGAIFYKLSPYQKMWKYILELRRYLKKGNYKIAHSHLNTLSVFPLFTAWTAGVPVRIAHNHSVPGGNEWKRNAAKAVLKKFSRLFATEYFACSEKAGRWLFGNKVFDAGKVVVVKNAVDFEKFNINSNKTISLRRQLGLEGNMVIGHIGRFTYAKNHSKLLEIFCEIRKRRADAKLLLVGDGELHNAIVNKISELGLSDSVVMVGTVSNPEKYYPLIDVVVHPSFFEGFSMTVIEAQISGVPSVISEAVPDEAMISDGCKYVSVKKENCFWADSVFSQMGKQVMLNKKSEDYDIHTCSGRLQEWYITHAKG